MAAEAFREIGVLIFVFSILDKMVSGTITVMLTSIAVFISALFFFAGIFIERKRTDG